MDTDRESLSTFIKFEHLFIFAKATLQATIIDSMIQIFLEVHSQ